MSVSRRTLVGAGLASGLLPRMAQASNLKASDARPAVKIVELRQYTLFGGKRDRLIELFETAFIEPQNALGAHVMGCFVDADDPDRFVWLRGFADMATRSKALPAFYQGPTWRANRDTANATMRDSDNVLLLRLLSGDLQLEAPCCAIDIHYLDGVSIERFSAFFEAEMRPRLVHIGAEPCATLATEAASNNFPLLPVRDREHVFVHITPHASMAELAEKDRVRSALSGWRDAAPDDLMPSLMRKPERLRLLSVTNRNKRRE